jgi:hypothetical protein
MSLQEIRKTSAEKPIPNQTGMLRLTLNRRVTRISPSHQYRENRSTKESREFIDRTHY